MAVANNIGFGEKQQTIWVRVALWGKRAEGQLAQYLRKGQQVFVSGELSVREYQAKDGTTKSNLELNANILDLVGKRNDSAPLPAQAADRQPSKPRVDNFGDEIPEDKPFDDDIPF